MRLQAKICGLSTAETVAAAVTGGASHVGFVFFARSPRCVTAARAADLARLVPASVKRCGLFVDAEEAEILRTLDRVKLDLVQLHGAEPPGWCRRLRERSGLPVMKAVGVASAADVAAASRWFDAVDMLLFDARPPEGAALPGGNGIAFDWTLFEGRRFPLPWLLSGGLDAGNLREAVRRTRAPGVDVSSGVETAPGIKDVARIREFLAVAAEL